MKKILFDAHAILKFYQDEGGADEVEKYLLSSQRGDSEAYMSEINLGEVYYKAIRRIGLAAARELLDQFSELPIHLILPSREIILLASEIKAEYAISYADCFAVASAEKVTASIITGDPEFKKVEHLVEMIWI